MKLKSLLTAAIMFASCALQGAEITPEKRVEIEKLLKLSGMEKLVDQLMGQMITSLKPSFPDVPEEFWVKFAKGMDAKELIARIVPIYDKYYTIEDLRAVNAFYETSAGQKVLSTLPQIMKESMQAGQEWGASVGERVAREVEASRVKKK